MARFKSATTMVLEMSDGGTIYRFAPDGVEQLVKAGIEWVYNSHGRCWSKFWLSSFCNLAVTYRDTVGCLVAGAPGADLAVLSSEPELWNPRILKTGAPLLNYTSVSKQALREVLDIISPLDIYLQTGVHVADFQPWAQIRYMLDSGWNFESDHIKRIVPLSDLISSYLTNGGAMMGGPSMYKSQGLLAHGILERLFPNFHRKIAYWPPWKLGDSFGGVFPCDHDSIFSRLIGFMHCPWVLWTGSWIGVARFMNGLSVLPNQKTYHAGIAFEGASWTEAAISNTGMFGVVYKELLKRAGLKYTEVYDQTREIWDEALQFKLDTLPKETSDAADWVIKKCAKGTDTNRSVIAIISFIKSVAKALADDLKNVLLTLLVWICRQELLLLVARRKIGC